MIYQKRVGDVPYNETYASKNESQEDLDVTHESSSDQEVVFIPIPSTSTKVASFQK